MSVTVYWSQAFGQQPTAAPADSAVEDGVTFSEIEAELKEQMSSIRAIEDDTERMRRFKELRLRWHPDKVHNYILTAEPKCKFCSWLVVRGDARSREFVSFVVQNPVLTSLAAEVSKMINAEIDSQGTGP